MLNREESGMLGHSSCHEHEPGMICLAATRRRGMLESTCCQGEDEDKLRIFTAMESRTDQLHISRLDSFHPFNNPPSVQHLTFNTMNSRNKTSSVSAMGGMRPFPREKQVPIEEMNRDELVNLQRRNENLLRSMQVPFSLLYFSTSS